MDQGGCHVEYMGEKRIACRILVRGNLKVRYRLEHLGVGSRNILGLILDTVM
jgi:hypothetical protein